MKLRGCKMEVGKEQREQMKQRNEASTMPNGGRKGTKGVNQAKK
jgi:hypothetical protein